MATLVHQNTSCIHGCQQERFADFKPTCSFWFLIKKFKFRAKSISLDLGVGNNQTLAHNNLWGTSRNSVAEAWNKACTCHLETGQDENLLNLLQAFAPLKPIPENAGGVTVMPLLDHPDGFMVASCHH